VSQEGKRGNGQRKVLSERDLNGLFHEKVCEIIALKYSLGRN
jgi:hypothetical protein